MIFTEKYDLNIKVLPAPLLIDNFIQGIKYSYEEYLVDVLNASTYFIEKGKSKYRRPIEEAHGEYDANSDSYSIDFKRIISQTKAKAKHELSASITQLAPGVLAYGVPKKENCTMQTTRIFAALREYTLQDLQKLQEHEVERYSAESDILVLLKTLEKKKNLFLFFPYILYFLKKSTNEECLINDSEIDTAILEMTSAVNKDFINVFRYRNLIIKQYETYFAFIFQDNFMLYKIDINGKMEFIEKVPITCSELYLKLKDSADIFY